MGASVIPKLATDIRNELPAMKGFSERNIKRMLAFHRAYNDPAQIVPQGVAQLPPSEKMPQPVAQSQLVESLLWLIPWGHHAYLLERVKDLPTRIWYMQQTIRNGWSRNILALMIDSQAHKRQSKAVTNFKTQLPPLNLTLLARPQAAFDVARLALGYAG